MDYSFNTEIAKLYGVNEAIFLQNTAFWLVKNKANNKNYIDGYYWTYNTTEALAKIFDFWSTDQINRIIRKLKKDNIIKVENHNKKKYDRTKWFTIIDEKVLKIYNLENEQKPLTTDLAKSPNGVGDFAKPIPVSKQDINYTTTIKENEELISIGKEITNKHEKTIKDEFDKFIKDDLNIKGFKSYQDILKKWKAWCRQINKFIEEEKENKTNNNTNKQQEQKNYRWDFRKAKNTSDRIKEWLDKIKFDWKNNFYWEDIDQFTIKTNQGDLKIGWQKVIHPDFNKEEILLFKVNINNLIDDDIIDV